MTLREFVEKSGMPEFRSTLAELEAAASFGKQCKSETIDELVTLGLLLDFGASEALLRKCFGALEPQELHELKGEMAKKAAALYPPQSQLPKAGGEEPAVESAFLI